MSAKKSPALEGIDKIIRAVEELQAQVKKRKRADTLIAYVEGVGIQVERALVHLRAEAHRQPTFQNSISEASAGPEGTFRNS